MLLLNRLFVVMSKPLMIMVSVIALLLCYYYLDRPIAEYFHGLDLKVHCIWLSWISMAGLSVLYIVGFFLAALFFRYYQKNTTREARMWFLWLCVMISNSICGVLKTLLGRARPEMWFEQHTYGFYGFQTKSAFWSFPSGHTTTIMAVAFGLCVLYPRYAYTFVVVGCCVALSRIALVQHYLSDVLTATCLVILEIGLLLSVLNKKKWLISAK